MAKQGLDYFSLDVTFDTSLEVIIAKSGDKALSSIVRIWQHIYKHNGYYMEYNEDELYMIKRMCNDTTIKELKNVIELMVSKNLFNKEMFDNKKILTSKRLQDNYKEATKRRINAGEPLTYCIHDVNIFKQSKGKERKVNKSKEKKSKSEEALPAEINKDLKYVVSLFEEELKRMITNNESTIIDNWIAINEYTKEEIKNALLIAIKRQNTSMPYIQGIMEKERSNNKYPDGFTKLGKPSLEETFGVIDK